MMNDDYILIRLYVPIMIIIILIVMIYFHRHHALKYLYLFNIICYLAAILSYFVLINHPVGEGFSAQWMNAVPFIWLIGIFAGYFMSVVSVGAFVVEHALRHIWARVVLGIIGLTAVILCIIGIRLFIQGVLSLKSG